MFLFPQFVYPFSQYKYKVIRRGFQSKYRDVSGFLLFYLLYRSLNCRYSCNRFLVVRLIDLFSFISISSIPYIIIIVSTSRHLLSPEERVVTSLLKREFDVNGIHLSLEKRNQVIELHTKINQLSTRFLQSIHEFREQPPVYGKY